MKELDKKEIYSLEGLSEGQLRELSEKVDIEVERLKKAEYIVFWDRWCYGWNIRKPTAKAIDLFKQEIKKGQVWEHVKTGERVEVEGFDSEFTHAFLSCGRTVSFDSLLKNWELVEEETTTISPHYNNDKGSLYQFCEDKQLNSYEFDIIKRVMRCRKKGQFLEDLEKTKFLIDLYIKEYNEK